MVTIATATATATTKQQQKSYRINQSNGVSSSFRRFYSTRLCQAEGHEFAAFQFARQPFTSFLVPSLATAALMQCNFRTYPVRDVGCTGQTCCTGIDRIRGNRDAAHATQYLDKVVHLLSIVVFTIDGFCTSCSKNRLMFSKIKYK